MCRRRVLLCMFLMTYLIILTCSFKSWSSAVYYKSNASLQIKKEDWLKAVDWLKDNFSSSHLFYSLCYQMMHQANERESLWELRVIAGSPFHVCVMGCWVTVRGTSVWKCWRENNNGIWKECIWHGFRTLVLFTLPLSQGALSQVSPGNDDRVLFYKSMPKDLCNLPIFIFRSSSAIDIFVATFKVKPVLDFELVLLSQNINIGLKAGWIL